MTGDDIKGKSSFTATCEPVPEYVTFCGLKIFVGEPIVH